MSPSGRLTVEQTVDRTPWKPSDGNGAEDQDFKNHKFYNPTIMDVVEMSNSTSLESLTNNHIANHLPKRVKLSDLAMDLIIQKTPLQVQLSIEEKLSETDAPH